MAAFQLSIVHRLAIPAPETHVVEKAGRLYYAFFAKHWSGEVALRGLAPGTYQIRDYFNGRDLGSVSGTDHRLPVTFEGFLLLETKQA